MDKPIREWLSDLTMQNRAKNEQEVIFALKQLTNLIIFKSNGADFESKQFSVPLL